MSKPSPYSIVLVIAAVIGLAFSLVSVTDFAQHLDRELHSIGCSYIPGLETAPESQRGCKDTMMSDYSSIMRDKIWGGLPIALPAIGLFAFILFRAIDLWTRKGLELRQSAHFLFLVSIIPLLASIIMGFIALFKLDAACATCIGIYVASFLCCAMAFATWRDAEEQSRMMQQMQHQGHQMDQYGQGYDEYGASENYQSSDLLLPIFGAQLLLFILAPILVYTISAPDHTELVEGCGQLDHTEDPHDVMVDLDSHGGEPAIEVFDPLCKTCRAFESRLETSGWADRLDRKAVLFPLDAECNWMIPTSVHPGACTISEAMLCAQMSGSTKPEDVKRWAFVQQDTILEQSKQNPAAARKLVLSEFPQLESCIGGREVRTKLNKSFRWAVANKLPVLTPQLYVRGRRLCEQDIDLGLDFAMGRLTGTSN